MDLSALLLQGVVWYGVFVVSTVLHEGAHAWSARRLGDPTAYRGGQASVDPLPHMRREPVGMIVVPALSYLLSSGQWMMGWASVPYNAHWALEHPRRAALMALAGPLANLALAAGSGAFIRLGLVAGWFQPPAAIGIAHVVEAAPGSGLDALAFGLGIVFSLNVVLFIFNLLPVPPLDGSAVAPLFMRGEPARRYLLFVRHPGFALLGLFAAWTLFGYVFGPIHLALINWLYQGLASYGPA